MVGTTSDSLIFLETLRTGGGPMLVPASGEALTTNAIGEITVNAALEGWGFGLGVSVRRTCPSGQVGGRP
jgi:hypothetical protein